MLTSACASSATLRRQQALEERVAELEAKMEEISRRLEQRVQFGELLSGFEERFAGLADRAKVGAAMAELATVKQGLGMFQAESDDSAYPRTAQVNSYEDLKGITSPYIRIAGSEDAAWHFVSYASASPGEFLLVARANDRERTIIHVTPEDIVRKP
jgi:hypothetical protein